MRRIYTFLFVLILVAQSYSLSAQVLTSDSLALVSLYNSTNGGNWTNHDNWLTGPVPTWFGITVDNKRVTKVELCTNCYVSSVGNNLDGIIPASIGDLTELTNLVMTNANLTGSIPAEIGNLTKLEWLALSANNLSGEIPSSIGNLSSLNTLYLAANQMTGELPVELFNLPSIVTLSIGRNQFSGSIPKEIGNLSTLKYLVLNNNQLTGSIPKEIGNLSNVTNISLEFNQLSGAIPAEIGNLSNLVSLYLYWNQLSGSIPSEIGNLAGLTTLYLYANELSGSIPKEIGNMTSLRELMLYNNNLGGEIPSEIGNLSNLRSISLYHNNLSGNIPASLGNLTQLTSLSISDNQLSGDLPASLTNLKNLDMLDVSNNQLTGAIPAGFSDMPVTRYMQFQYNQFTSAPDLSANTQLISLALQSNHLTFESIEPNIAVSGLSYLPQYVSFAGSSQELTEGDPFTASFQIPGAFNQYQWWKDGMQVRGASSSTLTIPSVALSDAGSYTLIVTNPKTPGLFFTTDPVELSVKEKKKEEEEPQPIIVHRTYSAHDLSFSLTNVGDELSQSFTIVNTGNGTIIFESIEVRGPFVINSSSIDSLQVGETAQISIAFIPDHIGEHKGEIIITSNADTPVMTFNLTGRGDADIEVYNFVSTRQNGKNDFLNIRNIALFPNNTVNIFDRWGNSVYSKSGYDNENDTFRGVSDKGRSLSEGTYFYMIDKHNGSEPKTGFLLVRN